MSYRSAYTAKITCALEYRLKGLHKEGHLMANFTKPYKAQWKPHTRAWGEDSWDGNTSVAPPIDFDSTGSSRDGIDEDRQGLTQWMAKLNISSGKDPETASTEVQDHQKLHQEQQRQANEQELARKKEERLQVEQQRQP
ncbi:hypothetical protein FCOIX_9502 [Fusarium coicis]|nr:hypothetical protein FCOIX_9502 [Fusarium coicis]